MGDITITHRGALELAAEFQALAAAVHELRARKNEGELYDKTDRIAQRLRDLGTRLMAEVIAAPPHHMPPIHAPIPNDAPMVIMSSAAAYNPPAEPDAPTDDDRRLAFPATHDEETPPSS